MLLYLLWICLLWLYLLSQLIAMLSLLYCFSVPITFITSFSYAICVPTFVMALVYFGMPRALRPPVLTLTYSLTHSLTHARTHARTHAPTHSRTY